MIVGNRHAARGRAGGARFAALDTLWDMTLYGVFGYPRLGADREFLGAYTTRERAQALIDAQDAELQMYMRVEEIVVDRYPSAEPWSRPGADSLAIAQLEAQASRIVRESGGPKDFDSKRWTADWLVCPHPALGGKRPEELLATDEGLQTLFDLLGRQQSGAYS